MAVKKKTPSDFPENLTMLDDLLARYYRELLKSIEEKPKLGDFIKMMELRHKIAPNDSDQKGFWKMLEKVRRDTLKTKPSSTHSSSKSRKRKVKD